MLVCCACGSIAQSEANWSHCVNFAKFGVKDIKIKHEEATSASQRVAFLFSCMRMNGRPQFYCLEASAQSKAATLVYLHKKKKGKTCVLCGICVCQTRTNIAVVLSSSSCWEPKERLRLIPETMDAGCKTDCHE